ncbi:MAG: LamG domain-containing protein [Clostridia bacterium]|nr:LamG domain-containing protein [Clostridia bacterium]
MKKILACMTAAAMLMALLPAMVSVSAEENYYTPVDSGYSGDMLGTGIYVGAGATSDVGNAEAAPSIVGTTVSATGMGIGKSEVALLQFEIDADTDPDTFGNAMLRVYATSVHEALGTEWIKLAVYETDNSTNYVALWGEMDLDSIPAAVNDDYSYSAAMWSGNISSSSLGWKSVDVTRAVKNALLAKEDGAAKVTLVLRLQVPAGGVDLAIEGENVPQLSYVKPRSGDNYINGATLEFSGKYDVSSFVDTPVATGWSGWSATGNGVNLYDYQINGTPSTVLQFFHTVAKGGGDEVNNVTAPTGGFGAGTDYMAFSWVLKRTAEAEDLYHDYTFYDTNGVAISVFRYDKNYGLQTGDTIDALVTIAPMTEGYYYRMIAVNNGDGTHNVMYEYSVDAHTYTLVDTRENLPGTVSGFGSINVNVQTWNAQYAHTGLGDLMIYSGNLVDASATLVYKANDVEIGRSKTVTGLYAGDVYDYSAPLVLESGTTTYIRSDVNASAKLAAGANEITVNYIEDAINRVENPQEVFATRTFKTPELPSKLTAVLAVSQSEVEVDVEWDSDSIKEAISSAGVKTVVGKAAGFDVSAEVSVVSTNDYLIVHYPFNENILDASGNSVAAETTGDNLSYQPGVVGNAAVFGGDTFISFSNMPLPEDTLTVSFYAKRTDGTFLYALEPNTELSSDASNTGGVYSGLFCNNSRTDLEMHNSAGWTSGAVYYTQASQDWAQYTIVYDGKSTYIYIDGRIRATSSTGAYSIKDIVGTDTVYGRIGKCPRCWDANDAAMNGAIDEFKIYSIALSAEEILNMNTPNSISVTTTPDKASYFRGEQFDPTGMIVTGVFPDGTERVITNYTFSPAGALRLTDTIITIDVNGLTDTVEINVAESFAYSLSGFTEGQDANVTVIAGNLAQTGAKLFIAAYDAEGALANVAVSEAESGMHTLTMDAAAQKIKAFIWSPDDMLPLAYIEIE